MTASVEAGERIARLEGEIQHVATKADLERLRWQLGGLMIACTGVILGALRLWL